MLVILYCFGNNDKEKSLYVFSTDATIHFLKISLIHRCRTHGCRGLDCILEYILTYLFLYLYIQIYFENHEFTLIPLVWIRQHRFILVFSLFILVNFLSKAFIFFNTGTYLISFPEYNQSPIAKSYMLYPLLDTRSTLEPNFLPSCHHSCLLHSYSPDFIWTFTPHTETQSPLFLAWMPSLPCWNSKTTCWAIQPTSTPSRAAPPIFSIHTYLGFLHPGLDCLPSPHRGTHLAQFLLQQILYILNYTIKWFLEINYGKVI